jgi:hypothetical protein
MSRVLLPIELWALTRPARAPDLPDLDERLPLDGRRARPCTQGARSEGATMGNLEDTTDSGA